VELVNGWAGAVRPERQPVPDFTLTDQDGERVSARSLRGKPVVFAFIYSTCRDTCPAQVQTIRNALDKLDDPDAHVIGISVDPANDTPKRAASFLLKQQMTGRMRFLLGTRAQLAPVWQAFGVQPQSDALEHSAHTVLADARGLQRIGFPFDHLTSPALAHDLGRLLG
jgi:protein SCO1/2